MKLVWLGAIAVYGRMEEIVARHDQTDMGGVGEVFLTTHWSLIEDIAGDDSARDRALIGLLLERYWKPVYCYLRRRGYDNDEAKDLTQGFFHEIVLDRQLVRRADPCKGRFRTFLLHALDQYLVSERRRETSRKRAPRGRLVPLEMVDPPAVPDAISKLSPETSYDYAWVASLLDSVLSQTQAKCLADGMETHWQLFRDRIAQPILRGCDAPPVAELCDKYGIGNTKKACNMITTVKRRLQKAFVDRLRQTAGSEKEIDEEFAEILEFLSKRAQHPTSFADV